MIFYQINRVKAKVIRIKGICKIFVNDCEVMPPLQMMADGKVVLLIRILIRKPFSVSRSSFTVWFQCVRI